MIIYKHGKDIFEPHKSAYTNQEATTKLSASENKILQFLIENNGEIIGREKLLEVGWPDKVVVANSLNVAIANLRKAFNSKDKIITTIKGEGFTIAKNTFTQQEVNLELSLINENIESDDLESKQVDNREQGTVNKTNSTEKKITTSNSSITTSNPLSNTTKFIYAACIFAMLVWVLLWASSWQSPPCVSLNNQQICGNVELLDLEKIPKNLLNKETIYIDATGKMYEKN